METTSNFKKLKIWQSAMNLVILVYRQMKLMPKDETYGLTSQIKRSAVSIPSNIAEGRARGSKEFIHFLKIAQGSLFELETQLLITVNLEMLSHEPIEQIINQNISPLKKQIFALIAKLKQDP